MPAVYPAASIKAHFQATNKRLAAIEDQLEKLSNHAGVPYEQPLAEIPQDVKDLARDGKTLEAMKRYRELTNAGADQALEVVMGL